MSRGLEEVAAVKRAAGSEPRGLQQAKLLAGLPPVELTSEGPHHLVAHRDGGEDVSTELRHALPRLSRARTFRRDEHRGVVLPETPSERRGVG